MRIEVEPIAASTTLVNLRLRYALIISNLSDASISVTQHADALLAGNRADEAAIRQWLASPGGASGLTGDVAAGSSLRLERELVVPLTQLSAVLTRGKPLLVPVLLQSVSYRHATGVGQTGRTFVIGKPGAGEERLGALPLDQGMGGFGPLAARDVGIAETH